MSIPNSFGYISTKKPTTGVASALAARSPLQGPATGYGGYQPASAPRLTDASSSGPNYGVKPAQRSYAPSPVVVQQNAPSTTPTPEAIMYDLNADPVLKQIQAFTGMSDQQAQADALRQKQQIAVGYGDANLARQLGLGEDIATAAGQNPNSTVAGLNTQRDRALKDLTDAVNAANLLYSGYRVTQEQQLAQDLQSQLAQGAGGVNSAFGTIGSNLAAQLAANQQQRDQAAQDAANRQLQQALALAQLQAAQQAAAGYGGGGGDYSQPPPDDSGGGPYPQDVLASLAAPVDTSNVVTMMAPYQPNPVQPMSLADAAAQLAAFYGPPAPAPVSGYSQKSRANLH